MRKISHSLTLFDQIGNVCVALACHSRERQLPDMLCDFSQSYVGYGELYGWSDDFFSRMNYAKNISHYVVSEGFNSMTLSARLPDGPCGKRENDRSADLILSCLPYLKRQSYRFGFDRSTREDLVAEGLCVLCRIVQDYDPSKGVPFPAYASSYVKSAMRRASRGARFAVHLPDHQFRKAAMAKAMPTILPSEEFREEKIGVEDGCTSDDAELQMLERAKLQAYRKTVFEIRSSLSADENIVLDILMDDAPDAARTTAAAAGISPERLRQIGFRLLPKMRNLLHVHGYSRDFLQDEP